MLEKGLKWIAAGVAKYSVSVYRRLLVLLYNQLFTVAARGRSWRGLIFSLAQHFFHHPFGFAEPGAGNRQRPFRPQFNMRFESRKCFCTFHWLLLKGNTPVAVRKDLSRGCCSNVIGIIFFLLGGPSGRSGPSLG